MIKPLSRLLVASLGALMFSSCASTGPVRELDFYITEDLVSGLMAQSWEDWRTKGGASQALERAESLDEDLRITMVNWDSHVMGLGVAGFDSEMRAAVSQEARCIYIDREHLQRLLKSARKKGADVDPAQPEEIFLPDVRDVYQKALRQEGENIRFAARGTLTKQRDVLKLELSVLDVQSGATKSVVSKRQIQDLPEALY